MLDPWIDGLWDALKKIFAKMPASDLIRSISLSDGHQLVAAQEKLESTARSLKLLDISDVDAGKFKPESETESLDAETPLEASLNRSIAPLSQSSLSTPALPPSYLEVCFGDVPTGEVRFYLLIYSPPRSVTGKTDEEQKSDMVAVEYCSIR